MVDINTSGTWLARENLRPAWEDLLTSTPNTLTHNNDRVVMS
jgi:hypothetical protein